MKKLFKNLTEFLFGCAAYGFRAHVLTVLWAWFVASTFGLPLLTIPAVLGLHLLYRAFKYNPRIKIDLADVSNASADIASVIVSALVLGCGYIIHSCM